MQLVKVLYCKLSTIGKELPTFPHRVMDLNRRPQKWEVSVLLLQNCGPCEDVEMELEVFESDLIYSLAGRL